MRKIAKTIMPVLFAVLITAGCSGGNEESQTVEQHRPDVNTQLFTVEKKVVQDTYVAVGTVRSKSTTAIAARVMGFVKSLYVVEGSVVTKGQLLMEIDAAEINAKVNQAKAAKLEADNAIQEIESGIAGAEAALAAAQANQELADSTYKRFEALVEEDSVSRQEFDEVKARMKMAAAEVTRAEKGLQALKSKKQQVYAKIAQAESAVEEAQIMNSYTLIKSPLDGLVVEKRIESGGMASPGMPLLMIEDNTNYRLETTVDESRITDIRVGDPVKVSIDALGGEILDGVVHEINPSADAMSRTFTVKISLGRDDRIRSGMFGRTTFDMGESEKMLLPAKATTTRGSVKGVFVAGDNGVLSFRIIKTGETGADGMVEVFSGIKSGEKIAVTNVDQIVDGGKVKVD